MELLQAFIFCGCYGAIAVAVWRAGVPFPLLFWFSMVEIPYSFMALAYSRPADLIMLGLGYCVCAEAIWHALRRDYADMRAWALISASALACIAVLPAAAQMRWGYLSFRHLSLAGFAVVFAVIIGLDWISPLACERVARINLRLLGLWLIARAVSSLGYDFYESAMVWMMAGWAFLAALAIISALYLTYLPRRQFS